MHHIGMDSRITTLEFAVVNEAGRPGVFICLGSIRL